ncbi:MAG: isoprenylcysteine carboxylmethyltransferase family protein [Bacilli bacterium]|jgi:protein-S-isoprenylcysteine O-methyltransferase Ste14|nr:isoprenylcysteine carboxylmethyltransferase family protein [Bacilli bacterium]
MIFRIFALLIMILFYSIYFGKMIIQKRQGIKTRQLGKGKNQNVRTIEILISIATLIIIPIQLISIILNLTLLDNKIRFIGFLVGILGDILFLIAIITMKNSWRAGIPSEDKIEFVSNGIYKISRNPAFVGFDLMYIGICLLYCNVLTIVFSLFAIIMLHFQILEEEKYLKKTFGEKYLTYKNKVCRYIGRK